PPGDGSFPRLVRNPPFACFFSASRVAGLRVRARRGFHHLTRARHHESLAGCSAADRDRANGDTSSLALGENRAVEGGCRSAWVDGLDRHSVLVCQAAISWTRKSQSRRLFCRRGRCFGICGRSDCFLLWSCHVWLFDARNQYTAHGACRPHGRGNGSSYPLCGPAVLFLWF